MTSNLLKLNSNKTELMVVVPKALLQKIGDPFLTVDVSSISPSTEVHNFKNVSRLQPSLSDPVAEKLIHAFITWITVIKPACNLQTTHIQV